MATLPTIRIECIAVDGDVAHLQISFDPPPWTRGLRRDRVVRNRSLAAGGRLDLTFHTTERDLQGLQEIAQQGE